MDRFTYRALIIFHNNPLSIHESQIRFSSRTTFTWYECKYQPTKRIPLNYYEVNQASPPYTAPSPINLAEPLNNGRVILTLSKSRPLPPSSHLTHVRSTSHQRILFNPYLITIINELSRSLFQRRPHQLCTPTIAVGHDNRR